MLFLHCLRVVDPVPSVYEDLNRYKHILVADIIHIAQGNNEQYAFGISNEYNNSMEFPDTELTLTRFLNYLTVWPIALLDEIMQCVLYELYSMDEFDVDALIGVIRLDPRQNLLFFFNVICDEGLFFLDENVTFFTRWKKIAHVIDIFAPFLANDDIVAFQYDILKFSARLGAFHKLSNIAHIIRLFIFLKSSRAGIN